MRMPWRRRSKRGTGWRRDPEDRRDRSYYGLPSTIAPPEAVDLSRHVPTILDQGETSSCVAHAFAYAIAIAESRANLPYDPISRAQLYSCARALTGDESRDEGTYLRSAARALQVLGVAPEAAMPFRASKINDRPPIEAMMLAHPRRGGVYRRIMGSGPVRSYAVRRALEAGNAVAFGAEIAESFLAHRGTAPVRQPEGGERLAGGHAMCLVGYDGSGARIVNSWTDRWGDGGFATLEWPYVEGDYCSDFWVISGWDRLRDALAVAGVES
jgi:Papain family cysteine protease